MIQPTRAARIVCFILGSSLILATFACQLQFGGPKPPAPPVDNPTDASALLDEAWASALEAAAGTGEVTITVNESQLNGFLADRLEADSSLPIVQPQVYLRQGQIQIYGISAQGLFQARFYIAIRPTVNSDGRLEFEILSAEVGQLPAPQGLKGAVSRLISEAIAGAFQPLEAGIRLTSIDITDGLMTIVGTIL
ncbi:MAG TPA: LmeA family phospholipid-binding protein [Anaerolineales bacterium]|nr:LmeA family phospholipid-binding protein [Anaerolineales bacterium]